MHTRLTPHYIDLVYDATLKSFWRKESLKRFLRNCSVPDSIISTWGHEETKRTFLDRLFQGLNALPTREEIFSKMGKSLIDQVDFPDLQNWEDSKEKLSDAKAAVQNLKTYVAEQDRQLQDEKSSAEAREKFRDMQVKMRKSQQDLENLSLSLSSLVAELGTESGGYKFQDWFFDLVEYFDIVLKRPYVHDGRQIDGSITILDTTYLVELKFTADAIGAGDIDSFLSKLGTVADNTMGIFVSMSGFTSVAIKTASRDKTPMVLMDFNHIYHVLGYKMSLQDTILRIRRHSSQTGEAYLALNKFSQ